MKTLNYISLTALASVMMLSSCSEDSNNSKYASMPPTFSDMAIQSAATGQALTQVKAGETFVAVMQQKTIGRLLNKTTYSWSIAPTVTGLVHKPNLSTDVVYDQQTQNPTDTLTIDQPGDYTLTFTASYNASGNTTNWSSQHGATSSEYWSDNLGRVQYDTRGLFGFSVSATRRITVVAQ